MQKKEATYSFLCNLGGFVRISHEILNFASSVVWFSNGQGGKMHKLTMMHDASASYIVGSWMGPRGAYPQLAVGPALETFRSKKNPTTDFGYTSLTLESALDQPVGSAKGGGWDATPALE